jgi:Ribosomal protein L11 methyltransferase (PrmA)
MVLPHVPALRVAKRWLVTAGRHPIQVKGGPARGVTMLLDRHYDLQRELGLYEVETHRAMRQFVRPGVMVIDVGAGDGYEALAFASLGAIVHAFDPDPEAIDALNANLALNPRLAPSIIVHPEAFPGGEVPQAAFAKVDVDGRERLILESLADVPALLVETHSAELENDCLTFLRSNGYTTTVIANAWWRPFWPEERPIEHNRWLSAERVP